MRKGKPAVGGMRSAAAGAGRVMRDRDLPTRISSASAATCAARQAGRLGCQGSRRSSGARTVEQEEAKALPGAPEGAGGAALRGSAVVPPVILSGQATANAGRGGATLRGGVGGIDEEAAQMVESMIRQARTTTAERRGQGRRNADSRRGGRRVAFGLVEAGEAERMEDPRDNIENVAPVWV